MSEPDVSPSQRSSARPARAADRRRDAPNRRRERSGDDAVEATKHADEQIPILQTLPMVELAARAREIGADATAGLTRQELIFEILRLQASSRGFAWGEGVLDILPDGFGFLRSKRYDYRAGPDDIYVSPSQIRHLNLKQGHVLAGPVRPPKETEKYFALLHVEAVNGEPTARRDACIPFDDLTPILPHTPLPLEHADGCLAVRLVDLLTPLGRGQRALVLSPPQSGRTRLLTEIAASILHNHDDIYVILLLLDERPEEVTEAIRRTGPDERREVVASTFDEPPTHHVALATMALEKAKRMVEYGRHVALVVDSLTALTRATNVETPHSGKILSVGLDASALQLPKQLFGAARCVEEGGSLTVVATVLTQTDSRMNDTIVDEFAGKANAEIVLDADLANLHVFPALDVHRSGTRREDVLLGEPELRRLRALRADLAPLDVQAALESLVADLEATPTNDAFLAGRDAAGSSAST